MRHRFDRPNDTRRPLPLLRVLALLAGLVFASGLAACGDDHKTNQVPSDPTPDEEQPSPDEGQSSFYSAAADNGEQSQSNAAPESGDGDFSGRGDASAGAESERQIEEGDIYRVLDHSDQILNLNRYRGLQIVDFTNPHSPSVIGRARVHGDPVEMYVIGDQVYALLNNWRAYFRPQNKDQLMPGRYNGGMVAVIDISDPKNPKIQERTKVPGSIETSRLTRGDGEEALFVVSGEHGNHRTGGSGSTYVRSFDVSGTGSLTEKSKLDLGGNVTDIQGAENHLLVARDSRDSNYEHQGSNVSVIDISDPSGTMVEGDQVEVEGRVHNKHNMDFHDDVLRVVSGATWSGTQKNHFETFDASNLQSLQSIDKTSFAEGERLEATLFMEDRAFFVTIENIDPFFAFELHDDGTFDQKSEFKVSGWNDYFVPVADGQRLVGIGMNNEDGRTMAVSLYDASDLTNQNPMFDRKEVPLDYSYSEANRDDRAFSVLENATNVTAEDGTVETGLVLLPFNGWDSDNGEYISGVRIFSFSESTVTLRGEMEHGTPVRRSFMAEREDDLTANLSEAELSIFDTSKPDSPNEQGRVELAPNYTKFWKVGNYGIRRDQREAYYSWFGSQGNQQKFDTLEVVPLSEHPDDGDSVAEVSIPAGSQVLQNGDRLVVAEPERTGTRQEDGRSIPTYETDLTVWDFSDPTSPKPLKTLTTDKLAPEYSGGYGHVGRPAGTDVAVGASIAHPYRYRARLKTHSIENALVFVGSETERELEGTRHIETTRPSTHTVGNCTPSDVSDCDYYRGQITCSHIEKPDGSKTAEHCRGSIQQCSYSEDGLQSCTEVDPDDIRTETHDRSHEQYDHWKHYQFHALDLSDTSSIQLSKVASMPKSERDVSHIRKGDSLYLTHRERYDKPNDSRPYFRYYVKELDFSNPTNPSTGDSVNIPGRLIEIDGDTLVTRDYLWGDDIVESSINKLTLEDGTAYLDAMHRFEDRRVENIELDGAGQVLVSHRLGYRVSAPTVGTSTGSTTGTEDDHGTYLSILDLGSALDEVGKERVDDWASLQAAERQRALFTVPGGLLVVDVSDGSSPTAQSFFPVRGWQQSFEVRDDTVYLAAGRYGIYRFDLDDKNLLSN